MLAPWGRPGPRLENRIPSLPGRRHPFNHAGERPRSRLAPGSRLLGTSVPRRRPRPKDAMTHMYSNGRHGMAPATRKGRPPTRAVGRGARFYLGACSSTGSFYISGSVQFDWFSSWIPCSLTGSNQVLERRIHAAERRRRRHHRRRRRSFCLRARRADARPVAPALLDVKGALETPRNSCGMVVVVEDLP